MATSGGRSDRFSCHAFFELEIACQGETCIGPQTSALRLLPVLPRMVTGIARIDIRFHTLVQVGAGQPT